MDVCGLKGRDCIEKSSTKTYNCSTACVGIYTDVVKMKRRWRKGRGEDVVKEKYQLLVAEYRKFKAKSVQHLKLDMEADSTAFGEF